MVRGVKNIVLLFLLLFGLNLTYAYAADVTSGIDAYKKGDFETCITTMKNVVKDDPTDIIGYYYLGLAYTKTGKEILAVQNYNKVINLNTDPTFTALAREGKNKLGQKKVETIETQIEDIEEEYNPILNDGVVNDKQTTQESNPEPKTTKVIKASDYAGANGAKPTAQTYNPNKEPTNDDIVNAIRTLQKAGLLQNGAMGLPNGMNNYPQMDSRTQQMNSMLMMMNNGNNNNNMMQMMPYINNGGKVDPQMMQMMLMQQMMPNFNSNNNNNGY